MKTWQKLGLGALLFGSIVAGGLFCNKKIQQQEQKRTEKRMDLYEKFLEYYDDTEKVVEKAEVGEILENCLQDLKHINSFHLNYAMAEQEYLSFIKIVGIYNENVLSPEGNLQATLDYLKKVNSYMGDFEAKKKKPLKTYRQINNTFTSDLEDVRNTQKSLPEFAKKKTQEYRAFFDDVETTVNADLEFINTVIAYASKRSDRDSGYARRIAAVAKKKRKSILSRVNYYKEMLDSNSEMLQEYFPKKKEPVEKSKFISGEF